MNNLRNFCMRVEEESSGKNVHGSKNDAYIIVSLGGSLGELAVSV